MYSSFWYAVNAEIEDAPDDILENKTLFILKCYCSGKCIDYGAGKIAFENLTPVDISTFFKATHYQPVLKFIYCDA